MEGKNHFERSQQLSPEKRELLQLEREDKYVFHGSGVNVETLEPRQAIDVEKGPDGAPGVFASNKAEYAIFMAIVNRSNFPQGFHSRSGAIQSDGSLPVLDFAISKETLNQLQDSSSGWVYVFNKTDFAPHQTKEGIEFVAHTLVTPVRKIHVSKQDLPKDIQIFE
jgi:hypothetical protein